MTSALTNTTEAKNTKPRCTDRQPVLNNFCLSSSTFFTHPCPHVLPFLLFQVGNEGLASEDDADTEEALKEFDFLVTAEDGEGAGEARSSGDGTEWGEMVLGVLFGFFKDQQPHFWVEEEKPVKSSSSFSRH